MANEASHQPSMVENWLEDLEQDPLQVQIAATEATTSITLSNDLPTELQQSGLLTTTNSEVRYDRPSAPNMILTSFPAPEMYIQDLSSPDSSVFADSLFLMLMKDLRTPIPLAGPDPAYLERHKDLLEALKLKFAIREAMEASIEDDFTDDIIPLPEPRYHTNRARALLSEFDAQPLPTFDDMYAQLMFTNVQLVGLES